MVHPVLTSAAAGGTDGRPRTTWVVDDYFVPGARTRSWFGSDVLWYHRTIEQYVRDLTVNGFAVTALDECAPVPALFGDDTAELARRNRVPSFLLLSAHRR